MAEQRGGSAGGGGGGGRRDRRQFIEPAPPTDCYQAIHWLERNPSWLCNCELIKFSQRMILYFQFLIPDIFASLNLFQIKVLYISAALNNNCIIVSEWVNPVSKKLWLLPPRNSEMPSRPSTPTFPAPSRGMNWECSSNDSPMPSMSKNPLTMTLTKSSKNSTPTETAKFPRASSSPWLWKWWSW